MNTEVMLALGVALFVAARVLYRVFRDDERDIFPQGYFSKLNPWVPWLLAILVFFASGLTVYSITKMQWARSMFITSGDIGKPAQVTPVETVGVRAGSVPIPQQTESVLLVDPGNNPTSNASASNVTDSHELIRTPDYKETSLNKNGASVDWLKDWSGLLALIFAALGIVMTLVTTIVISVSRSAVDDIRRLEKRMVGKKSEILLEYKELVNKINKNLREQSEVIEKIESDQRDVRIKSKFSIAALRAHIANSREIEVLRGNIKYSSTSLKSGLENEASIRTALADYYVLNPINLESQCLYADFLHEEKNCKYLCENVTAEDKDYLGCVIENIDHCLASTGAGDVNGVSREAIANAKCKLQHVNDIFFARLEPLG